MAVVDLAEYSYKLTLDSSEYTNNMKNADAQAETMKTRLSSVGDFLKTSLVAGMAAAGAAIVGTVAKSVKSADEFKQAMNGFQSATGVATESLDGYNDALKNIYAGNYGESFEDIAAAMTTVTQTAKDIDPSNIEQLTKSALTLRDTFDYDVGESMRAANMLMDQFGISGDEAFNLIAQGAQGGLDKNGDLLDSINEYSVHFQQLGLDADDMFNSLANGAEDGTFSVDKLGDAVKEFGIRVKDGSANDTFKQLGLDANTTAQAFAKGGETASQAFTQVTTKLFAMKDPLAQNQAGVALFGTMWEDLGADGVQALTNLSGSMDSTKSSMQEINAIKYDSFGEAIQGIGRQLETGLILPLGEKLLPNLEAFATNIQTNMPQIQSVFETAFSAIGNAITLVSDNLNIIIPILAGAVAGFTAFSIINTIVPMFTAIKTAIQATTTVQAALNAIMAANPFGAVALAIGALVTAGVALYMNWDTVKAKCAELQKKLSEIWTNIKTTISTTIDEIKLSVTNKFDEVKQSIFDKADAYKQAGQAIFQGVWDGMTGIWKDISSWVTEKVEWLTDKLSFWKKSQSKMKSGSSKDDDVDGSHANGLSYVPFDGYKALLHKGERVLTAKENAAYNSSSSYNSNAPVNIQMGNIVIQGSADEKMLAQIQQAQKQAVNDAVSKINQSFGRLTLDAKQRVTALK